MAYPKMGCISKSSLIQRPNFSPFLGSEQIFVAVSLRLSIVVRWLATPLQDSSTYALLLKSSGEKKKLLYFSSAMSKT
jgi:hypothetical protein